jgi:hypothetical protein
MNITRRLLLGSVSALTVLSVLGVKSGHAHMKIATSQSDRKLIASMVRAILPHDRFPDGPYLRTVTAIIAKANGSPASALTLRAGLIDLKSKSFESLGQNAATEYLKDIEGSSFFSLVHGTTVTGLYTDKEVFKILGYEEASFDKGGYINRGFNDLNWLPEPRIDEHPDLAAFLSAKPKQYASTTQLNAS